jgi:hypothetical protein
MFRGISAAGSAFEWHSRGHGFEPRMLHFEILDSIRIVDSQFYKIMKKAKVRLVPLFFL